MESIDLEDAQGDFTNRMVEQIEAMARMWSMRLSTDMRSLHTVGIDEMVSYATECAFSSIALYLDCDVERNTKASQAVYEWVEEVFHNEISSQLREDVIQYGSLEEEDFEGDQLTTEALSELGAEIAEVEGDNIEAVVNEILDGSTPGGDS